MPHMLNVIVPMYNLENYITPCIMALKRQSYVDFEVIIVDDGSTDNSVCVCKKAIGNDRRFRIIQKKNGGVSSARNCGLDESDARYITFIDGDDVIAPFMFESLIGAIKGNVISMCLHEVITDYEHCFTDTHEEYMQLTAKKSAKKVLQGLFPVGVWGAIFIRELIGQLRFSEGIRNNEDKLFMYQYLLNNEEGRVAFSNQKMYGYYSRNNSATKAVWNGRRDIIQVADVIDELTMEQHPEWANYTHDNRIISRMSMLKSIIMTGGSTREAKCAFEEIKSEALSMRLSHKAGLSSLIEYYALKMGDPFFKILVMMYYKLVSEERRNKKNERRIVQKTC